MTFKNPGGVSYLLAEDEEGGGVAHVVAGEGAVDGGFVNQSVSALGRQDLPLLFVEADVRIRAETQQGDNYVQVVVGTHGVEHLRHQTL